MEWYLKALKNYAGFDGRSQRSEYWYFWLGNLIISLILTYTIPLLSSLFSLAILIPSIAAGCRRMHDIGKSGWMMLIALIPIVGALVVIYWFCQDSEPGNNMYGSNPKSPDAEVFG